MQPELFDHEDMVVVRPETREQLISTAQKMGFRDAGKFADRNLDLIYSTVKKEAGKMGIDLETIAGEQHMHVDDLIMEMDVMYELVHEMSNAYLKGMSSAFPIPMDSVI